jgi:hypothetical protein
VRPIIILSMLQAEYEIFIKEHPEAKPLLEFHRASRTHRAYWKFRRDYSKDLTDAEKKHRIAFSEANSSVFEEKGLRLVNGEMMPAGARAVQDQLKGKQFTELSASEKRLQSARKRLGQAPPRKITIKEFCEAWRRAYRKPIIVTPATSRTRP